MIRRPLAIRISEAPRRISNPLDANILADARIGNANKKAIQHNKTDIFFIPFSPFSERYEKKSKKRLVTNATEWYNDRDIRDIKEKEIMK